MKYLILLTPLCLLFLTACPDPGDDTNGSGDKSKLPESFDKLSISISDGGGMLPVSYHTEINNDSAYWEYSRYGNETIIQWIPTKDELNDLYVEFRSNELDNIKSDCEGEVYDRGGITLRVNIDGNSYEVDNSGNCFIQEKWQENYRNIIAAIAEYRAEKINEQMLTKPVEVTESLMNCGYDIEIQVQDGQHRFTPSMDTISRNIEFYPGVNEIIVRLSYKDSTDYYGSPANFAYEQFFDTVNTDTKRVLIDWKEEKVVLNCEN